MHFPVSGVPGVGAAGVGAVSAQARDLQTPRIQDSEGLQEAARPVRLTPGPRHRHLRITPSPALRPPGQIFTVIFAQTCVLVWYKNTWICKKLILGKKNLLREKVILQIKTCVFLKCSAVNSEVEIYTESVGDGQKCRAGGTAGADNRWLCAQFVRI